MIFLTDKYNNANLIYYTIINYKRVVRSVLGSKTLALADACDASILIQKYLKSKLKKTLKIKVLTDSLTQFNLMIRNAPTTKKD